MRRDKSTRTRREVVRKLDRASDKKVAEFYSTRGDNNVAANKSPRRIPKQLHASVYLFKEK